MRPLTLVRPKPLLPILNRPMVDHMVLWLPDVVDRVVLAVNYMADAIREHLRSADLGVEVRVVEEDEPLGTGGAFKNCIGEVTEDAFIGLNGDLVSSLDMGEMVASQAIRGGIGTIALWEVEDPSRFGVVELGPDGRISSFVEKPPPGEAPSNLINAGAYVLRTEILDSVRPGVKTSIEREVFPRVLDRGLHGHRFTGFWADAGTPSAYLEAHRELLDRIPSTEPEQANVHSTARVLPHSLLGEDVTVGEGAEVGPYAVLGEGVRISRGARLRNCVLFPRSRVGAGASLEGCILGEGADVAAGETLADLVLEDGRTPQ